MTAIKSKFKLNNRSDKRMYTNEAIRAAEFLQHIVDDFVEAVFDSPSTIEYKTIYQYYLELWSNTIRHLKKVKPKFKVIHIDPEFFSDNYSPFTIKLIS